MDGGPAAGIKCSGFGMLMLMTKCSDDISFRRDHSVAKLSYGFFDNQNLSLGGAWRRRPRAAEGAKRPRTYNMMGRAVLESKNDLGNTRAVAFIVRRAILLVDGDVSWW